MGNWNRHWVDAVRRQAHTITVKAYNGELHGIELEEAIVDLVKRAAEQREKREETSVLHIVRSSYHPEGAA